MRVLIIDDEELARQNIKDSMSTHPEMELLCECRDGFEGFKAIQELKPDLVFLDIQMPRINGFEMLELLENPPAVVFVTAFDEFAMKAFDMHAVDYLLKPFSQERFDAAVKKAVKLTGESRETLQTLGDSINTLSERLAVRHKGEIRILDASEITYIEAWDDYIKIHIPDATFVKKQTLNRAEDLLSQSGFIRCHRSYLVNISQIQALDQGEGNQWEIRLKTGFHIPLSKQGYQRIREVLGI